MLTSLESTSLERFESRVILKDGSTLDLRAIRHDDEQKMVAFLYRLTHSSSYFRFHHALAQVSKEDAKRLCSVDYQDSFAIVGTSGQPPQERIIAVAHYHRLPKRDTAEVTFLVEDKHQGKGIGSHLLQQLTIQARKRGIRFFEGEVLAENQRMMKTLQGSGLTIATDPEYGISRQRVDIAPTAAAEEKSEERDRIATVASLQAFLNPRSIAVVGASRRQGSIGNKLFRNILLQGFTGTLYPVNPNASAVSSVRTYSSIFDIPGEIDLAVIVVPAEGVLQTVEACGRHGVRGVIVISAGFGETGAQGERTQEQLLYTARNYGMRLLGPNCMGVINTNPEINMNATFSSITPPAGNIALCSQSGALGLAILEYTQNLNIGLSNFISIGNRADISSNDLLQYWEVDPATKVILLYLESFGNPREFARIAPRVTRIKPVVAVKSGRTPAGSKAAASHTGALATTDVAPDALFRQAGIVRVNTLEELFDVANLLSHQPVPSGNRVAILTNGGGPGIMTADACATRGLEVATLSAETIDNLRNLLPRGAGLANPIDMTAEANPEHYEQALKLLARDDNIDSTIVIFIPPILTTSQAVANSIRKVAPHFRERGKVLLASLMGSYGITVGNTQEGYVPSYSFPEASAGALAKACEYGNWIRKPKGIVPLLQNTNKLKASQIVKSALSNSPQGQYWLDALSVIKLLECYGIQVVESKTASTAKEAALVADQLEYPVCVKLLSDTITHKTEVGGVILNLRTPRQVEKAFSQTRQRLAAMSKEDEMQGVLIQKMIPDGVEVIVGVTQDPLFGPLTMFGMGGTYAELFKDVSFRIHPLTDVDVREMIQSVKTYQLLEGWRGSKRADIESIEDLLLRVSQMVEDIPQITELDLNPVKVLEDNNGYQVVDARILLTRVQQNT
ncbi:MAG: GNAT family N-acetyltransferase [Chloroflexota bacterium]|nr:GNAT family N-acetyltransferase [Chloroflexota bacterium]